jgi:hypothetical protein
VASCICGTGVNNFVWMQIVILVFSMIFPCRMYISLQIVYHRNELFRDFVMKFPISNGRQKIRQMFRGNAYYFFSLWMNSDICSSCTQRYTRSDTVSVLLKLCNHHIFHSLLNYPMKLWSFFISIKGVQSPNLANKLLEVLTFFSFSGESKQNAV